MIQEQIKITPAGLMERKYPCIYTFTQCRFIQTKYNLVRASLAAML